MVPQSFRCYLVEKDAQGRVHAHLAERRSKELPEGEVIVRVAYSSLNYKDAMAAKGHPGVNKVFPHIPGVDAAGIVAESGVYEFVEGDPVLVTGFQMGTNRWGGFAEYIRVPMEWIVPLPEGLSLQESMILGTAGLTAGLAVHTLQAHNVGPQDGEVAVTGASGGVGSIAVALLARLGYRAVAITGKASAHDYLRELGAAEVVGREVLDRSADRPMRSARWAGAVDVVGGGTLAALIASTRRGGCIAACGMVGGGQLETSVFPFILRGVTLAGIDTVLCPLPLRHETWAQLAGEWKPDCLQAIGHIIEMDELPSQIEEILAGRIRGRVVVRIGSENQ